MSDALGGAPRPPRPPANAAEAGARGQQRPTQALQQTTAVPGIGTAIPANTRQMVIGVSPSGSPRLTNAAAISGVGVRLVGNNLQLATGSPRLLLAMDTSTNQQQQGGTPQLQSSWISVGSPTILTATQRRQVGATVATPIAVSSPATVTASSSILRPLPAASFVTPSPAKRHLASSSPASTVVTATTSTTAARKRLKLDPDEPDEVPALRRRLLAHKATQLHESRDTYTELLAELFFLQ
ncbi:hypothetical protein B566_EDAN011395, partial [Ephemera danica]